MSILRDIRAFSLIELMVVIAIVAVLSAVAVPAYKNYTTRAEIVKVFGALVPTIQTKITEYYNRNGQMPSAVDLGIQGAETFLVNSTLQASGGPFVSYVELSKRVQGQSLCPSSAGCTDLVIGWNASLINTANLMWVRFVEINGAIQTQCGLHENVPSVSRGLYPSNCQGISPGYTTFSVS